MAEAFETELERLVARVAHELARDITALILRRLGVESASAPGQAARALRGASAASSRAAVRRSAVGRPAKEPTRRRGRASSEERAVMLAEVERALSGSGGMGLGEIERATKLSRSALTSALKALKEEGRVFMGGTRRFARYATSQAAADRASLEARRGAAA
jgi:DNA-binding transcriptional ArsR family regulator